MKCITLHSTMTQRSDLEARSAYMCTEWNTHGLCNLVCVHATGGGGGDKKKCKDFRY